VVNVHALLAVAADGHWGSSAFEVTPAEDGAGWLGFFRRLNAPGLTGASWVASTPTAGWSRDRGRMPGTPKRTSHRLGDGTRFGQT
jgi:transposase-like protein